MPTTGFTLGYHAAPARLAATLTMLFGLAALAGWVFGIPSLSSVLPGATAMRANTAVTLILCGASLLMQADRVTVRLDRAARILALAVVAIGVATLAEYVFELQMGIDRLLLKDADLARLFGGRMSPYSAAAFVLIGLALAAMHRKPLYRAVRWAAVPVIFIGAAALAGYVWHFARAGAHAWLPLMAINTAACFVMLGAGVLLSPEEPYAVDTQHTALGALEIKILSGCLLAMSLLLFGGSYTYRASVEFGDSVEWVGHTQEVRKMLADVYGALAGAELAQRDFLLIGALPRHDDYLRLTKILQAHLADLERLTGDDPLQKGNLVAVKSAVEARLEYLASGLEAYQDFGLPAARAVSAMSGPRNNIRAVRLAVERMDAVEVRPLSARQALSAQ